MFETTTQSNYLAKVVRLGKPQKHPNADKLQIWNVNGYEVITDMSSQEGDIKIFFPVECQIHDKILCELNMYSDSTLNEDKTKVGYISANRRVKAVKLRGVVSDGIVLPYSEVVECFSTGAPLGEAYIGESFDTIGGMIICNKYTPARVSTPGEANIKPRKGKKPVDLIVPGQFNFHYDTSKLQDNIWRLDIDDVIVITDKWHGTSAIFSNLLVKRKLSWLEKVKKFLGAKVKTSEYKDLYASRSVIKGIDGVYENGQGGYYNTDIWGKVFQEVKDVLLKGMTIYGEIVGYSSPDRLIQKGYDYGCKPGEHQFRVYRITTTHSSGRVEEWSWHAIQEFCETHDLETVPEVFYGTVSNFVNKEKLEGTDESLLDMFKRTYLEGNCVYCKNKVPAEGICIRNESGNKIAYKLKSKAFLLKESADLDNATEVLD